MTQHVFCCSFLLAFTVPLALCRYRLSHQTPEQVSSFMRKQGLNFEQVPCYLNTMPKCIYCFVCPRVWSWTVLAVAVELAHIDIPGSFFDTFFSDRAISLIKATIVFAPGAHIVAHQLDLCIFFILRVAQ